jgi:hypothetical protein
LTTPHQYAAAVWNESRPYLESVKNLLNCPAAFTRPP